MKVNIYIHLLQTSELLEIKKLLKNCLILNVAYPAAPQQMKKQWNKRTHTHTHACKHNNMWLVNLFQNNESTSAFEWQVMESLDEIMTKLS